MESPGLQIFPSRRALQAILSSPDKRLTLNQVYDWLISNVSYFSDRQDTAASAGWKVKF